MVTAELGLVASNRRTRRGGCISNCFAGMTARGVLSPSPTENPRHRVAGAKDRGSKPLDHKVIRRGNTEPDGRIKQMAAKVYALSESGTFPPFSASLTITCLCSQIFMAAEFSISPV